MSAIFINLLNKINAQVWKPIASLAVEDEETPLLKLLQT